MEEKANLGRVEKMSFNPRMTEGPLEVVIEDGIVNAPFDRNVAIFALWICTYRFVTMRRP